MLNIRKATADDAEELHELYFKYLTANPPQEEQDMNKWNDTKTQ